MQTIKVEKVLLLGPLYSKISICGVSHCLAKILHMHLKHTLHMNNCWQSGRIFTYSIHVRIVSKHIRRSYIPSTTCAPYRQRDFTRVNCLLFTHSSNKFMRFFSLMISVHPPDTSTNGTY